MEIEALLKPGLEIYIKTNDAVEPYQIRMCSGKLVICKAIKNPIPLSGITKSISILRPANSGMFVIEAKIKDASELGGMLALHKFGEPKFFERRAHYRLTADEIDVEINIELRPQNSNNRYKRIKLFDISAGGIGLIIKSSNTFSEGMPVQIAIDLETVGQINLIAEVMHVTTINPLAKDYLVGLRYTEIDRDTQEALVGFIKKRATSKQKADDLRNP